MSIHGPIAPPTPAERRYLTPEEVSALTRGAITVDRLRRLRFEGGGPPFLKPSPRRVLYLDADVHAWIAGTRMLRTDQAA